MKFAYRDSSGKITECVNLGKAVSMVNDNQGGTVCKLTLTGRWYGTTVEQVREDVREMVALHNLRWLIRRGYSESGTDVAVPCAEALEYGGWQLVRMMVMMRDGHRCRLCEGTAGMEVHHILPRSEGGTDNPVNLIALCSVCHKLIHRKQRFFDLRIHKMQTRLEEYT